MNTQFEPKQY